MPRWFKRNNICNVILFASVPRINSKRDHIYINIIDHIELIRAKQKFKFIKTPTFSPKIHFYNISNSIDRTNALPTINSVSPLTELISHNESYILGRQHLR